MRLLSCFIRGFGKLEDAKFDFEAGLTNIKEDNSFGKTTLAKFIVSMFYDLPDFKVRDLSNDRRRNEPWHSGAFGGTLTFFYDGKKYQIERDFRKKDFRLFDISSTLKKEVDRINGRYVDGSNLGDVLFDINKNSFKRSAYIPQDEIICGEIDGELNDKLRSLINETDENHSLEKSLDILQKSLDEIETKRGKGKLKDVEERISELNNKIDECQACLVNAERGRKELKHLQEKKATAEKKVAALEAEIAKQNEVETVLAHKKLHSTISENIKREQETIANLMPFFLGQDIEAVDLSELKAKIDGLEKQQRILSDIEDETLRERSRLHSLGEASLARQERKKMLKTQIDGLEEDKKRSCLEKENAEKQLEGIKKSRQQSKGIVFILLCIFTLGLFFVLSKSKNRQLDSKVVELENIITSLDKNIENIDAKICDAKSQMAEIDACDGTENMDRLSVLKADIAKEQGLLDECKNDVENALSLFDTTARGYIERYHEIKENLSEIKRSQKALEESKAKLGEFLKDKDREKLFNKVETDFSLEELQHQKGQADSERLILIKEISDIEVQIAKNDERAEMLTDFEGELAECRERQEKLVNELFIIKKTMDFLREADEELANMYLTPLLEKTCEIIAMYDPQMSELEFDLSSKILIKEKGIDRELDYFSKGIKELVSICLRIALLDIIFKDDAKTPCIILDDPFVNLDDKKLEIAKSFVKNLAEKYQIIYLTCHKSREIV